MSIYLNNPWKPVRHDIFRNDKWANELYELGYKIINKVNNNDIVSLLNLFNETHTLKNDEGGMFYSVYSQDIEYRRKIHNEIHKILMLYLQEHFQNFKVMINSFVVKLSGPDSEFYLHQDTTGLDEWKFSPLNLWIPLIEVNEQNGCLGIIEKSHHFFSPYRSISFPAPFDNIQGTVKQYLKPVSMTAGEVLVFDNRMLHNSYKNISGTTRVAVICGLFPKDAKLITCHKPEYKCGGKVELIEHDDDFLLTYPKFLINCQDRPHVGKSIGWVDDNYYEISKSDFLQLCEKNNLKKTFEFTSEQITCNMIAEPK
jgi:hypothetical protein